MAETHSEANLRGILQTMRFLSLSNKGAAVLSGFPNILDAMGLFACDLRGATGFPGRSGVLLTIPDSSTHSG